jgi:DNA-binding Lrp family transcriptional regulator
MAESKKELSMSTRDRDRLKILHEVQKRHISQKQAAIELGLSTRWVRKLPQRPDHRGRP